MLFYSTRQSGSLTNRHSGHQLPSCNASSLEDSVRKRCSASSWSFSQRSASTSRSLSCCFSQQEQRLILDELAMFSAVFCCYGHKRPQSVSAQCSGCSLFRFTLTSSVRLLPFGCGERQEHACKSSEKTERSRDGERKGAAKRPFFHRLRPLTSITEADAQISGGETRQDYKDIRRFPLMAPLVRSPVPAIRFTGVIPLLWPRLSHSTPDTQFREGSSLQAGLYARTPPVQSDRCALTGKLSS